MALVLAKFFPLQVSCVSSWIWHRHGDSVVVHQL